MIYTIGHRDYYSARIRESQEIGVPFRKLGEQWDAYPCDDGMVHVHLRYPGGYAFRTVEDAQARIDEAFDIRYAVFGLEAEWGVDTEQSRNGPWHRLLRDARIVPVDTAPVA